MRSRHISLCGLPEAATEAGWRRLNGVCGEAERLSVGSSLCEMQFLAWGPAQIRFLQALTRARGLRLSLVLPCPREKLFEAVLRRAEALLQALDAVDEVVLNDEALAFHPLFRDFRLCAGRELCKYEHDFRLDNGGERTAALGRALRMTLSGPFALAEADCLDPGLAAERLPASLRQRVRFHTPAVLLSATRHCQFAVRDLGARDLLRPYEGCERQCERVRLVGRDGLLKHGRGIYRLAEPEIPDALTAVYWPLREWTEAME